MKHVHEVSRKGKFLNLIPGILTGISVVSFFAATVFGVEATPKALKLIEEEKEEKGEELTTTETIEAGWRPYKKALIFLCLGTVTAIAGCAMNYEYAGALLAAGTVAERGYSECKRLLSEQMKDGDSYKKVVIDAIGEEEEEKISKKANRLALECTDTVTNPLFDCSDGYKMMWFRDKFTGQDVYTCVNNIKDAIRDLNAELHDSNEQTMNDYCNLIGLKPMSCGELIYWDSRDTIKVMFDSMWDEENQTPLATICFKSGYGPKAHFD